MKPRKLFIGFAALVIMVLAIPISTRAFIPNVQPQFLGKPSFVIYHPDVFCEKGVKYKYIAVRKLKGYGTGYFGPKREDYASKKAYLAAIRMNGEGKETWTGAKPRIGTLAADMKFYPPGTIIYIPEINLWGKVEDIGPKVKGRRHIDIFCGHGRRAERIANKWGAGTPITLVIMKRADKA